MGAISDLQKLLLPTKKPEAQSYFDYFKEIAEILMNKCVIVKCGINYEIVDIEFYLFAPDHQDVITYPRKLSAGKWFFHQSGVDLTFESNDKHFGGILIRGIKRLVPSKDGDNCPILILGPQKCVEELWDSFDAFNATMIEYPIIKEYAGFCSDVCIQKHYRWINIPEENKASRIKYWSNRIMKSGISLSITEEEIKDIVFKKEYRFSKGDLLIKT